MNAPDMRYTVALFVVLFFSNFVASQNIVNYDEGVETFVDEENFIRVISKQELVSYEIWDLSRDKRRLSHVIKAPKGSQLLNYVIINPVRLKEGDYMIKLITENDVKKVWFNLPEYKKRERKYDQIKGR